MLYLTDKWDSETVAGIQKGNWNMADSKKANDPAQLEHMNFWHLNKTERLRRLENFTKFMVVRGIFRKNAQLENQYFSFLTNFKIILMKSERAIRTNCIGVPQQT